MKQAAWSLVALALSGCGTLGGLFGPDAIIKVEEIGRATNCAATSADASVQMFPNADAVVAWQGGAGVTLIGTQAMLPGTYVLVGIGQRASDGYGLLIAPEAEVDNNIVRLRTTYFEPTADRQTEGTPTSPCVLVRLPQGDWRGVDVYDQNGRRRVQARSS
ncbi:protease complex subunit PrcB family protein [Solimonas flava]|uniref:protease complex subunit PrcB family protein n=1 Tax=Solimonas flava TaxID=415849 RepID=UPI0004166D85|nr:protease complex subunit PrcB family protein [Solimonas flava]